MLEISLEEEEEDYPEFKLRLKNGSALQRKNVTGQDRKDAVVINGVRDTTIHGTDSTGRPCSLVVFHWQVVSRSAKKRIRELRIEVTFATKHGDRYNDPHVRTLAPEGTYSLMRTSTAVESKRRLEGSLSAGFGGPEAGVSAGYELSRAFERAEGVTVGGLRGLNPVDGAYCDPDRCNSAEWNLAENETQRSGIPADFYTAVLLERQYGDGDAHFTATVDIRAKIDAVTDASTSIKRLFGRVTHDDPIVFDPSIKEQSRFAEYAGRLEEFPFEETCKFMMFLELTSSVPAKG